MADNHSQAAASISQDGPKLHAIHVDQSDANGGGLIYLEQFHANTCKRASQTPLLVAFNAQRKAAILFHPACKCWDCEACAQTNKRRWIARAINGATVLQAAGQDVDFVTLTSHEKLKAAGSRAVWPKAWKKLHARWGRKFGKQAYFAVPELHADGRLHAHMICTGGAGVRWWKDNARACGMGYQSDVQEIDELGIGGYVGKYLGKTLGPDWPRNGRRVRTSRDWPQLPTQSETQGWTFRKIAQKREISAIERNLNQLGYDVARCSPEGSWALLDAINLETAYHSEDDLS